MKEEHCEECAGLAALKGETCFTCDGYGNIKKKEEVKKKKSRWSK